MRLKEKRIYPVFLGLTRPPMVWGVPQNFAALNFLVAASLFVTTHQFLMIAIIAVSLHIFAAVGCSVTKEPRFLDLFAGRVALRCRNRNIWGCNSYETD